MRLNCILTLAICTMLHAGTASIKTWEFPHESEAAWFLGSADAAWAIAKPSGQLVGGWNARTRERYLNSLQGRYHLEDRTSLVTGAESGDRVLSSEFLADKQRIELVCANPGVPDLTIRKRYWVEANKLYLRTAFRTQGEALQFITYNCQASFDSAYRDGGYYMGGGDGGGPLVPAPRLSAWRKVIEYQNTTKGMLLHQPEKGYSFAHIRTRLDDQFVWPWFTGAIASYVERVNVMHYTPDGWDFSLGTSRLSPTAETSYEQYLSVSAGDWQRFLTAEYAALPAVQQAFREIPPVPDWVGDVKFCTGFDLHRLQRMVKMTDEGTTMVLVWLGGNWADYHVDRGLRGGFGGRITGEETRDLIRRIKALSPRIKVGVYMWVLSALESTRTYREHPEWFRYANKDGEPLSTFPGHAPNYAHLLSIPECYKELLSQFDLMLGYLGTDFIYLDDPKAINMVDWRSGEYTRDDLSFRFFLDVKRTAAKHGPDKVVFFNNRGNPYGDINFIEARSQLRASYWRRFAGIAAVTEAFLISRPKARIAPLYYTPPLAREYINRVLALGWIPSLTYGDVIARRAFVQAAYEVGNCSLIPARYSPDWKRDSSTTIESYAVQRHGDSGYLLSFISHEKARQNVPVRLDLESLGMDRDERVYVWEHLVANALEYQGSATESFARDAYTRTGWQLDRVTQRRLAYAGPYRSQLELELDMEPLRLYQLYVTAQPAAVYSEDGLPANYLFGQTPKVKLQTQTDWENGSIRVQIDSARKEAEIALFVPMTRQRLKSVSLDGRSVDPVMVCEGDEVLPVINVAGGRHTLTVLFDLDTEIGPVTVEGLSASEALRGIRVALPGFDNALLTVAEDGRVLFSRMSVRGGDGFILPPAPAREKAGECTVALRAVVDSQGRVRHARAAPATVQLAAVLPELGLGSPTPPTMPGQRTIEKVDRQIASLQILRSAVLTTPTVRGGRQPDLRPLMARAVPDDLLLEAGTTRKVAGWDNQAGAAFAGFEIEDLRKVRVRLSNSFHNAFHLRGPGNHVPPRPNSRNFAGIVVDYHTPEGYAKRVRFAVGVLHPKCSSRYPDYGRPTAADAVCDLGALVEEGSETTFALDLEQHAPEHWDGQVWLSVGSDWVAGDRRLKLQILAANDAVTGEFLRGKDPDRVKAAYDEPRTIRVPRSPGGIIIDGSPDEEMWGGAAKTEQFFLLHGTGISKAKTSAMLLYDDESLYVAFTCLEPARSKPLIKGGPPWGDDAVEVWIDASGDGKTYRQVILNGANDKMEYWDSGPNPIGANTATHVAEGYGWMVEMTIPFSGLGVTPPKPGESWRLSLCRGRPEGKGFNQELIVWAPLQEAGFRDLANFGTLIFR